MLIWSSNKGNPTFCQINRKENEVVRVGKAEEVKPYSAFSEHGHQEEIQEAKSGEGTHTLRISPANSLALSLQFFSCILFGKVFGNSLSAYFLRIPM